MTSILNSACSDSLVEEAAGGKSAVQSFRESDEEGFRVSEVIVLKYLVLLYILYGCLTTNALSRHFSR